jgi:hypothetical protein
MRLDIGTHPAVTSNRHLSVARVKDVETKGERLELREGNAVLTLATRQSGYGSQMLLQGTKENLLRFLKEAIEQVELF